MRELFVCLFLVVCVACQPSQNDTQRRVYSGMNIDPMNTQYGAPSVQQLQSAGVQWLRIEFKDASMNSTVSSFNSYDGYISSYFNGGMKILMILGAFIEFFTFLTSLQIIRLLGVILGPMVLNKSGKRTPQTLQ